MSHIATKVAGAVVLFLVVIVSGLWLGKSSNPLNVAVLTVHKLVAVAVLVILAVTCYRMNEVSALGTLTTAVVAMTVIVFLGAIASGGFLSTGKEMPSVVLIVHRATSALSVLSTGMLMFLLRNRL